MIDPDPDSGHDLDLLSDEPQAQGVVDRFTWRNQTRAIVRLRCAEERTTTILGELAELDVGSTVRCWGDWKDDPQYGRQLQVNNWETVRPQSADGIERLLREIPSIGRARAARLVERYGEKTLEVLEDKPLAAKAVLTGVSAELSSEISTAVQVKLRKHKDLVALQKLGLTPAIARRVVKWAKRRELNPFEVVAADPYVLREIKGIGWATVDRIGQLLKIASTDPRRIAAAAVYALEEATLAGHVCLPRKELLAATLCLLGDGSRRAVKEVIVDRVRAGELLTRERDVYLRYLHQVETALADGVLALLTAPDLEAIPLLEPQGLDLSDEQRGAVELALRSRVLVLTGGPGVGKTTIVRVIVDSLLAADKTVALASPTGKAAQRLADATGLEAKTLHRLLEFLPRRPDSEASSNGDGNGGDGDGNGDDDADDNDMELTGWWGHTKDHPLPHDLVVVDEASMLDVYLARRVVEAVDSGSGRLVLVGDIDQLPSVGPGRVLADLIDCGVVPVVRLTKIFRQAAESSIIRNAHLINSGKSPTTSKSENGKGEKGNDDMRIVFEDDPKIVKSHLLNCIAKAKSWTIVKDPIEDVQVLTPMHRGPLGTIELNEAVREILNPQGRQIPKTDFRIGDRVMQTKNDYKLGLDGVFNGEVGIVVRTCLIENGETGKRQSGIVISFNGGEKVVEYPLSKKRRLKLAYVTTIHKSQGSEYPVVLLILHRAHSIMAKRNLLYTGVTRGKSRVALLCDRRTLRKAVRQADTTRRHTNLRTLLTCVTETENAS